ncbi:MAG: AHH domain-containing protein [Dysgonomonas sp.]
MAKNKAKTKIPDPICPFCEEAWAGHKRPEHPIKECPDGMSCGKDDRCGVTHVGSGTILAGTIDKGSGRKKQSHPLYMKKYVKPGCGCLEAHHLICSEAMDEPVWDIICQLSGYSINCYRNGVYLPTELELACHAKVPLHRGGHEAGYAGSNAYPEEVRKEIRSVLKENEDADCSKPDDMKGLVKDLNASSVKIFNFVANFIWTITRDGFDYEFGNPIGCANVANIPDKNETIDKLQQQRRDDQNNITKNVVEANENYLSKIDETRAEQANILQNLEENAEAQKHGCPCGRIHKDANPKLKKLANEFLEKFKKAQKKANDFLGKVGKARTTTKAEEYQQEADKYQQEADRYQQEVDKLNEEAEKLKKTPDTYKYLLEISK